MYVYICPYICVCVGRQGVKARVPSLYYTNIFDGLRKLFGHEGVRGLAKGVVMVAVVTVVMVCVCARAAVLREHVCEPTAINGGLFSRTPRNLTYPDPQHHTGHPIGHSKDSLRTYSTVCTAPCTCRSTKS